MQQFVTPQFVGSVPKNYDEFLGPMLFEPYAADLGKLVAPLSIKNALELACGTGRVTRHLRRAIPQDAKLIASDLSPEMLAVAQSNLHEEKIDWRIVNAQNLQFDDNQFDLVVCYFGYMFVPDRQSAYREALRVLRKGGMLLMATWDALEKNTASFVFRRIVQQHLDDIVPGSYRFPYSMHDTKEITSDLTASGFSQVHVEQVEKTSEAATSALAAHALVSGGSLYNEIMKRDPALIEKITSLVEIELADKYGVSPMRAPMQAIITRAFK